jgi:hypothetical protein
VEDGIIFIKSSGATEVSLVKVLVELEILRVLPVSPIILLDQAAACEAHDVCGVVADVAREDNVVALGLQDSRSIVEKIDVIVELVMSELGEVFFGHNRDTTIGDV